MKILLLAPHPFYQERGTPIAVDLLLRALSERGDEVDVLTYHLGEDRNYRGVKIYRIKPIFAIRSIRPGFSWKKIYCDLFFFIKVFTLIRKKSYDLIHAVEESVFMAYFFKPFFSIPYIYDMDSLMSMQITDKFPALQRVAGILKYAESKAIRRAVAVIPVCDALAKEAEKLGASRITVLKDVALNHNHTASTVDKALDLRREFHLNHPIVMYIGNLEPYQGIDLLLEAFRHVLQDHDASLIIIGGQERDIQRYKRRSQEMRIQDNVVFLGPKPIAHIQEYMAQADVLVSPRIKGTNTPMKIYSYMASGVPIVATDLYTHTQILSKDIAVLVQPEPAEMAAGIISLIRDPARGKKLAQKAAEYVKQEHSYEKFKERLFSIYEDLEQYGKKP